MSDKQLSFADLWAAAEDYTPQTEMSLQEQIAYKRNSGWAYLTEEDVRGAKTFDNKPYDGEDLIETTKEEEDENESIKKKFEQFFKKFQYPILSAMLYFLFQLPFMKKNLLTYLPFLFKGDGNYNNNGYVFSSILFGIILYSLGLFI